MTKTLVVAVAYDGGDDGDAHGGGVVLWQARLKVR